MTQTENGLEMFNSIDRVQGERIGIYDCTLRDGEQAAGVVFDRHDKLEIARCLDKIGVDRIEVGMPVVSQEDHVAAEEIVADGLRAELWGFCRCIKEDIDACISVGLQNVILEAPTSPYKLKAYNLTREVVKTKAISMIEYARGKGLYVAYFSVDATRTDEIFLEEMNCAAVEAGAQEVVLADTLSVASPNTIGYLAEKIIEWTGVPLMIHCHNDFGLATACTLAGVQAGATYAHVTVNGLGEKAGNADIAEVVGALDTLMGYRHGLNMQMLPQLSELVEKLSGVSLSPQKPIVGTNAFKRESGVVTSQLYNYPPAVEAYDPAIFGRETDVVLGKKSGKSSIKYYLNKLGYEPLKEDEIQELVLKVKELSLAKRRCLKESEFIELLEEYSLRKNL